MDEDMEYVFQAGGDACGICLALDGTNHTAQAHPNCSCQIVSKEGAGECEGDMDWRDPVRHGDRPFDINIGGELTVTCSDGTEVGESIEWDASGYDPNTGWNDFVEPLVDAAIAELCSQCQESDSPAVV